MRYQLDNPPTREMMCAEFGIDEGTLRHATNLLDELAAGTDALERGKERYTSGEVARLLRRWGLSSPFVMLCRRFGGTSGRIKILSRDLHPSDGRYGVATVSARFDKFGLIELLEATVDYGSVGDVTPEGIKGGFFKGHVTQAKWRGEQCEAAAIYGQTWRDWIAESTEILTVARYRVSNQQAWRKFVSERWFDPDVPSLERVECELERKALDEFVGSASTLGERLNEAFQAVGSD